MKNRYTCEVLIMRIELISPTHPDPNVRKIEKAGYVLPLGLALLAALTPTDVDITITDEAFDSLDFSHPVDLVGITAMTTVAPRAFEIADQYLQQCVPVIIGGIHPTLVPEECLPHATSIVQGDGERLWPRLIQDFQKGTLRKIYREDTLPPLDGLPTPRRELIKNKKAYLLFDTIQATRGCIHCCSFCTVSSMYRGTLRSRPIEDVLRDMEDCEGCLLFFVDDNIIADRQYAKHLFREMIPLKKNG